MNFFKQEAAAETMMRDSVRAFLRASANLKIVSRIEDTVFLEPTSRLHAVCMRCQHVGPRTAFMTPRPKHPGLFDDTCPRCHTDEVEIFDPRFK